MRVESLELRVVVSDFVGQDLNCRDGHWPSVGHLRCVGEAASASRPINRFSENKL